MTLSKFIGSKWVPEILTLLADNKGMRFSDIMNNLDITDKVLSEKMTDLQKYSLVNKDVKGDRSTFYSLTGKGREFAVKLVEMDKLLKR